jgi:hypothetical protein
VRAVVHARNVALLGFARDFCRRVRPSSYLCPTCPRSLNPCGEQPPGGFPSPTHPST